jgi:hypothetical protein
LISLPLLEQVDELGRCLGIRHDEVQRVLHHVTGSAVLADHVEVVVGLGGFIEELRQELKTLNSVDGVAEVLHAASAAKTSTSSGSTSSTCPSQKPRTLVVEGFHECSKLR